MLEMTADRKKQSAGLKEPDLRAPAFSEVLGS
jgi:hypothetical protein